MTRYCIGAATALLLALVSGAATGLAQTSQPPSNAAARGSTGRDAIVPIKIQVPEETLRDLKARLARTRFPEEIPGTGWDYGTDLAYLKSLVTYWRDSFDWRAQERKLNEFDQFNTPIDGLRIHFIHQRSKVPNAFPLAVTHGWPGSIVEFTKIIGPLTGPGKYGGPPARAR